MNNNTILNKEMKIVKAPFTVDQVKNLNEFQVCGFHEFTCGNIDNKTLIASEKGWHCPGCDYTQDWALAAMCDGSIAASMKCFLPTLQPSKTEEETIDETLSVEDVAKRFAEEDDWSADLNIYSSLKSGFIAGHAHAIQSKSLVSIDKVVEVVNNFMDNQGISTTSAANLIDELKNIK